MPPHHAQKRCTAVTRRTLAFALVVLLAGRGPGAQAAPGTPVIDSVRFAVIVGLPPSLSSDTATRALLDRLRRTPKLQFAVWDGALRRPGEPCVDALFAARRTLLDTSAVPLVVIPGRHDWEDCDSKLAGGFDPVERLDFVRQTFFDQPYSLGSKAMHVVRQSDLPRFRQYRENLRWETGGIAFVTLNVPDGNNHYSSAGGRNGEFEDRAVANAFWLRHAGEYAKRRKLKAISVLIDADPDFERYEQRGRLTWLRWGRGLPRDGYVEFKRTLVELSRSFSGTVVLIHGASHHTLPRVRIDQPLHDDRGERIQNFTRVAIARAGRDPQWLDIRAEPTHWPVFHVSERAWPDAARFATIPPVSGPPGTASSPGDVGATAAAQPPGAATAAPERGPDATPVNGLWLPGGTTTPANGLWMPGAAATPPTGLWPPPAQRAPAPRDPAVPTSGAAPAGPSNDDMPNETPAARLHTDPSRHASAGAPRFDRDPLRP
ncbi:unnamed protein product [Mycetohabitans rhizoxinica HKI 454]|uniref:Transmembrane protein n=2 Tax=Mycetohabitans rhizoxinica TaxID=412963 RepID=E5AS58_MYCRK|nr:MULTISPECIES: hypothetical protein [Mycetohabitans]MCF7696086.1 hypothetical protein [Mycetohabitans sp. B2]MCG1047423.1 hypothetical protein [Mycetohabitans sp. B6]QIH29236.1 hypothetical protein RBRH_RS08055 [Mycetohabitans rhizoxinica]CBW75440.1 unnamed protein product [Mycetohabitans rhizoxinica HKI 454]